MIYMGYDIYMGKWEKSATSGQYAFFRDATKGEDLFQVWLLKESRDAPWRVHVYGGGIEPQSLTLRGKSVQGAKRLATGFLREVIKGAS